MPETCCAVGCNNVRDPVAGISLYRIPKEKERREKWLAAIDRKSPDGGKWEPSAYQRLCSQHFASGAKSDHPLHPDFVPSIFPHTSSPKKRQSVAAIETFTRRRECKRRRHENARKDEAATALLDLSVSSDPEPQTHHCGSDQCTEYFNILQNECQSLRNEVYMLREKVNNRPGPNIFEVETFTQTLNVSTMGSTLLFRPTNK
uniref:THAP-type domain-containing protein n=1 Tax=Neogobius melanostomus TaxID=47308 RepID=A0A8C6WIF5_9GOBI